MEKLNRIVDHALTSVPYYQDLELYNQWKIKKDVNLLPILTKDEVSGNESKFISQKHRMSELEYQTTSGSSGI